MDAGLGAESYDESGGTNLAEGIIGVSAAMDPLEAVLGPFPCARLRGLPFEASLEDVLSFFTGLVVLDVVVLNPQGHAKGQGQGEAFVVFANPMDFQMALQRDQQRIGRASIDVFQGKRHDYYAAIAAVSTGSVLYALLYICTLRVSRYIQL
jgi:heterogeneous nuclear ribonucleoprotein F/H